MNQFYSDCDETGPSIAHLRGEERPSGSVTLKICGPKLLITISGEPPGHLLLEQFQEGVARKLLYPGMRTLVDMTRFIGVVEAEGRSNLHALPRISWDGRQRSLRALRVMLSGAMLPRS